MRRFCIWVLGRHAKNFQWHAYNAEMHGSKKQDVADLGDMGVKSSPIGIDDIPRPMGCKKA